MRAMAERGRRGAAGGNMPTSTRRKTKARRWSAAPFLAAGALLVWLTLPVRTASAQEPVSQPETAAPAQDQSQPQDADQQNADDNSDDENAAPAQPAEQPDQQQVQPGQAEQPAAPPVPQWPVNEKAKQASVTWDAKGLSIDAAN